MNQTNPIYSSSRKPRIACALCEGVMEHEAWCAVRDPGASYAYLIVADASRLTEGDSLILHSLGVAWTDAVSSAV